MNDNNEPFNDKLESINLNESINWKTIAIIFIILSSFFFILLIISLIIILKKDNSEEKKDEWEWSVKRK